MKISGFQKTSLIDYPGHIVSIIFTQACNFRCPYCHNSDLINSENKNKDYFPLEYIINFIKKRKGLIDGISITGGEPTIQDGLHQFIQNIKLMDLKVKLDTNGSKPEIIAGLLKDNLLDYIAMDVKGSLSQYEKIANKGINTNKIKKSISLIKESNIDYEFRTTVVPGLHDKNVIRDIASLLQGSKQYFIQNFRANNTLNPEFMKKSGYPPSELKEFKDICTPYIDRVEIRN